MTPRLFVPADCEKFAEKGVTLQSIKTHQIMAKKILVTGAGGFIGGFIVEEALRRGYETWAAVRTSTNREYLADERINFLELDFSKSENLRNQLAAAIEKNGKWDYIIHNLGATKCNNFNDFNKINYIYLRNFIETLKSLDAVPEGFLLMSSLSAMGAGDEKNYTPITSKTMSQPNTRYGVSKLKAESFIQMQENFPYIIFRATGVYGPRERDYFMMIKSIKTGFDFSVGMRKQLLTFIYVKDLTKAMFDALESKARKKVYIISEDKAYTQKEFRKIVADTLGKKFVMPIRCPLWLLYVISFCAEVIGQMRLKPSTLNRDKYKIMKQRNWNCDVSEAKKDFNFTPEYDLKRGIEESVKWYKENGWI